MIVAINDLSFQYEMSSLDEALDRLYKFIELCELVEDGHMKNVEKVVIAEDFECSCVLASGLILSQIIQYIRPRDKQRKLMSLIRNRDTICVDQVAAPFCIDGKTSKLCACVRNDMVISLRSSPNFDSPALNGTCEDSPLSLDNLSLDEHIHIHQEKLGIRVYCANAGKHKPNRAYGYGKGKVASPMDLDDELAQKLLNKAIQFDGKLHAKKGGKYYTFMSQSPCVYHGYIDDRVPEYVQKKLDKLPWD